MKRWIHLDSVAERLRSTAAIAPTVRSWRTRWAPFSFVMLVAAAALLVGTATLGRSHTESASPQVALVDPHLVVLKSSRTLHLLDGDKIIRSYPIDLGVTPFGQKRRANDGRTPEGSFRIVTKNSDSPYHRFIGIDYPGPGAVDWGLASGLISPGEATSIRGDLASRRRPNWETPLGGGIGLHGHRTGTDWTGGCVALSDSHIEEVFSVVRIGDPIDILP